MYSTYDQYQEQGGPLNEARYRVLAEKAASIIDYRTLHRAGSAPAEMQPCLGLAECELVEILDRYEKAAGGLASENIDGYSYTVKADPAGAQSRAIDDVLRRYLFRPDLGVNLLCRGLDSLMVCCDKTVTLVHAGYDGRADTDTSSETVLKGVSWYSQNRAAVDSTGLHHARIFKCRIPENVLGHAALPVPGDVLRYGDITATVLDVHDNRGHTGGHVYVEAS